MDTLLNALDADPELFDAELNLAQTKRNELLSLVRLYKALGGSWQQEEAPSHVLVTISRSPS